jgi:hypothetical protein
LLCTAAVGAAADLLSTAGGCDIPSHSRITSPKANDPSLKKVSKTSFFDAKNTGKTSDFNGSA